MKEDVYLCSYPRSGNTWTRLLLSDIFMQCHDIDTNSKNVLECSDKIIPDEHCCDINNLDERIKLPFRIIKTHHKFDTRFQKTIFLFRSPADSLTSYFHFLFGTEKIEKKYENNIDLFVIEKSQEYKRYCESFLNSQRKDMLFISYESLFENAVLSLKRVLSFLNYTTNDTIITKAIDNHTFDKHKGTWKLKTEGNKGGSFFRKGKIGSSKNELKEETLRNLEKSLMVIHNELLQIEEKQIKDYYANN